MDQRNNLIKSIAQLSEAERLDLFNVEELESRLEMAAVALETDGSNGACNNKLETTVNAGCW